jgi:hypothetical protein
MDVIPELDAARPLGRFARQRTASRVTSTDLHHWRCSRRYSVTTAMRPFSNRDAPPTSATS